MATFVFNGGHFVNPKWGPCRYLHKRKHCLQIPHVITFPKMYVVYRFANLA